MADMKESQGKVFDRVLARRARRLGISESAASDVGSREPIYLVAAQGAAARLGKSAEAVLEDDLRRVESSTYPSASCLTPDDLEELIDAMGAEQISFQEVMAAGKRVPPKILSPTWASALDHLTGCDPCRTLLATCLPSEARKREFEIFLEKRLSRTIAHS